MNSVCLMGRICKDLELKTTQNGNSVVSFTLAVDRAYTPKGQERQTDFIDCVAWRQTAEFISRYFRKGNKLAVEGSLQQRSYTANDGSKRSVYEVVVANAYFCSDKKDNAPSADVGCDNGGYEYEDVSDIENNAGFEEIAADDDLPF